jgi:hypothetical protein
MYGLERSIIPAGQVATQEKLVVQLMAEKRLGLE